MMKPLTIKDFIQEGRLFNQRVLIISGLLSLMILALMIRLAYLQIQQHQLYTTLSWQNQMRLIPIAPNRGLIYDRKGKLLVENLPIFNLEIVPDHIKNIQKTIAALQEIIPLSQTELDEFYKSLNQHPRFVPVPLKLKLTEEQIAKFYINRYRFPGVIIEASMLRYYPYEGVFANVVGHVGRINTQDLKHIDKANYSASDYIGKTGIEQYYENILHGKVGYQQVEIDASGRTVRVMKRIPPIPGENLYLTIDADLQVAAQEALGNTPGAIVAIQPSTGQVLAMVSNPSYNPNIFVMGISHQDYETLLHDPKRPLFNRSIRGQYPTGSTIKPFLALEGLDTNTVTTQTTIYDPGWFKLPNAKHIYHDWQIHHYVNISKAIIVSCDTFFYRLAVEMGIEKIDDILNRFGFGQHTGIDINGELPGLIPSPNWKITHIGKPWYTGDTVITGIGQGFLLATPLQLADGVAAIAEQGLRYKPYLVLEAQSGNQNPSPIQPSTNTPVTLMHKEFWNVMINVMEGVIFSDIPGSTNFHFGHPSYTVAAKPGTAEFYKPPAIRAMPESQWPEKYRNNLLFIAFAPIDNPQIALAVVTEHSDMAPTIARKVIDYYLINEKNITPSNIPIKYYNPLIYPNAKG